MTDIVERLRIQRNPMLDGERAEAADEIERLREECTQRCAKLLREAVAGFQADLRAAKAEIERLRREQAYSKETRTMQAEEIERLRRYWQDRTERALEAEIDQRDQEIERLLRKIRGDHD